MSIFESFTFLRPLWLLAIPALALIWFLSRRAAAAARDQSFAHIAPHLRDALTIGRTGAKRLRAPDLILSAAMLMALAAAGPAWRAAPSPFVTETAPLVIALDLSASMANGDIAPSRLDRAKQKIRDLIALRAGGRIGLIAYAGTAHVVMPLTEDPTVLLPFLEGLEPGIMPRAGQRASAALALGQTLLAGEETPGSLLYVTDGIEPGDISAFPPDSGGVALVVAPEIGAEVTDWSRAADVTVVRTSLDDGDLRAVQRALSSDLARAGTAEGQRRDDGWIAAIPAALLLLLWFRRGTTLGWAPVVAALALLPGESRAEGLADWFWTPDQQGARLYADHQYAEAAETFTATGWKAAALFRSGGYDAAAQLLEPVATATAQYVRGTALARGRDYQGARAAFEAALLLDPDHADARHNLDVTERIIAYLTEARDQSDTEDGTEFSPDGMVEDLEPGQGKPMRIDAQAQLSEEAAAQWMQQVETRPGDFLKSRFAIEAAQ